jgi:hypothetical protein
MAYESRRSQEDVETRKCLGFFLFDLTITDSVAIILI